MTQEILEQLKSGSLPEYTVKKEDFMSFREVLVKREDFKHFIGTALRHGEVTYQYQKEPRK